MGLIEEFDAISKQISQQRHWMTTEQATINVAIQPFIRALGYDTNNLAEVRPEYSADAKSSGGERVDYAILREGKPIIFIEAKAANISLNESTWKQLYNYFNAENLRFGILTNGLEYQFYTDLKKRNIMDKEPFMTIDMLDLDERLVNELRWFTKSAYDPERLVSSARSLTIIRMLQTEFDDLSTELIKYLAYQGDYSGSAKIDVHQFVRLFNKAWTNLLDQEIAKPLQSARLEKRKIRDVNTDTVAQKDNFAATNIHATYLTFDRLSQLLAKSTFDKSFYLNLREIAKIIGISDVDKLTKSDLDKLGKVLRGQGWKRGSKRANGQPRQVWIAPWT